MDSEIEELLAEIEYWYQLYATEVQYRTMGGKPMDYHDRWDNRPLGTPEPGAPSA